MMTLTLEIPTDLDEQIQAAARAQNTNEATWLLEVARRALKIVPDTTEKTAETRDERINKAITDTKAHFAPMLHGGDAVSQLLSEKRTEVERAAERGL